jgi:hypothetical protein
MRGMSTSRPRTKLAHGQLILAKIGERLREEYDATQPLPDRLADLVKKIEQSETVADPKFGRGNR